MDKDYYLTSSKCTKCGAIGLRHAHSERCYFCEQERLAPSPRKQAMINGETTYMPTKPCVQCETIAPKRVDNGQCIGCKPNDGRSTATTQLMHDNPDMVLSRDDAETYGFTVYRTGTSCRRGHRGWRYVSTGNCIDCRKGVTP